MPPRQCVLVASAPNTCSTRRHAPRRILASPVLRSSSGPKISIGSRYYSVSRSVIPTSSLNASRTRDPSREVMDTCYTVYIAPTRPSRYYHETSFVGRRWDPCIRNVQTAIRAPPYSAHPRDDRASKPRQRRSMSLALPSVNDLVQISTKWAICATTSPRCFNDRVDIVKHCRSWTSIGEKHYANHIAAVDMTTHADADAEESAVQPVLALLRKQPHNPPRALEDPITYVNRPVKFGSELNPPARKACVIIGAKSAKAIHMQESKWSKKFNYTTIRVAYAPSRLASYVTVSYIARRSASGFALKTSHSLSQRPVGEHHPSQPAARNPTMDRSGFSESNTSSGTSDTHNNMPILEHHNYRENNSETESTLESSDTETKHIPLRFQIPPVTVRAAMSASENSAGSFYSQALYRGPNDELISIHYCHTLEIAERVAKYFLEERVLGFDIEWKPFASPSSIKENASLIQLACEDRIALFHIAMYQGTAATELLPPSLRTIIESQDICKVGVAIKGDFSRLEKYLDVKPRGVFELSRLHNLVEYSGIDPKRANSKKLYSLAKQVRQHLQLPLFKGAVRESDWSQRLKFDQITYAATDAYASFRIFDALESKRKKLGPVPPRPLLCDFDSTPQAKAAPRTKTARKAHLVSGTDDSGAAINLPDEESDSEGYEVAADELMDSYELEDSSDHRTSTSIQERSIDPDADCISPSRRTGQFSLQGAQQIDASENRHSRRVGHIDFSALARPNPKHPARPDISPNENLLSGSGDVSNTPTARVKDLAETRPIVENDDEEASKVSTMATIRESAQTEHVETSPKDIAAAPIFAPLSTYTMPQSPEWTAAHSWAQEYSYSSIPTASSPSHMPSRIRATIPHLRAYHMWRHQKMSTSAIAKHLRDPPLAEGTVAGYILQAVILEKLEYKSEDLKDVLRGLPWALRAGRWRWLIEKIGGI